jgi:hypothetical protein
MLLLIFPLYAYGMVSSNAWTVSYYMAKEPSAFSNIINGKETETFIVEILKF